MNETSPRRRHIRVTLNMDSERDKKLWETIIEKARWFPLSFLVRAALEEYIARMDAATVEPFPRVASSPMPEGGRSVETPHDGPDARERADVQNLTGQDTRDDSDMDDIESWFGADAAIRRTITTS